MCLHLIQSMDVIGHLDPSTQGMRFMLVLTDYFSKLIEAVAFSNVTKSKVKNFVWKDIIYR